MVATIAAVTLSINDYNCLFTADLFITHLFCNLIRSMHLYRLQSKG